MYIYKPVSDFLRKILKKTYAKLDFLEFNFIRPLRELKYKQAEQFSSGHNIGLEPILIAGELPRINHTINNYFNQLSISAEKNECWALLEWPYIEQNYFDNEIKYQYLVVPEYRQTSLRNPDFRCPPHIRFSIIIKPYLRQAYTNICAKRPDMEPEILMAALFYTYKYCLFVLDIVKPTTVVMWNEFMWMHIILSALCKKRKISIRYIEFGQIPGTISIEKLGQMGRSYPAKFSDIFRSLDITTKEFDYSKHIIAHIVESGMIRYPQSSDVSIDVIKQRLQPGRPTIFFAGCNDVDSGLVPYTYVSKKYNSPIFKSSVDAVIAVEKLAIKNGWNLIFKPHPQMRDFITTLQLKEHKGITYIDDCDINKLIAISDIVITLVSTVSYDALFRAKPVVMLGYSQLRNQGCCYEAFESRSIESVINDALEKGITSDMHNALVRHVAQMVKYNLFDDYSEKQMAYGQSLNDAWTYITS